MLDVREMGLVLPSPRCIRAGGTGIGAGVLLRQILQAWCAWAAPGQRPACSACSLSPVSSCNSLREPALERGPFLPHHFCMLLPVLM